jgi:hypothetical protein
MFLCVNVLCYIFTVIMVHYTIIIIAIKDYMSPRIVQLVETTPNEANVTISNSFPPLVWTYKKKIEKRKRKKKKKKRLCMITNYYSEGTIIVFGRFYVCIYLTFDGEFAFRNPYFLLFKQRKL